MAEEPINVRVAKALGCEPFANGDRWCCPCDSRLHSSGDGSPGLWSLRNYLHDDAFCWRILKSNKLDVVWNEKFVDVVDMAGRFDILEIETLDLNEATLEWIVAAVSAGVEVVNQ
jgi:hypothetical protein